MDYGVPVAVRGTINFKISDYKNFIKLHRLVSFDLEQFKTQINDAVKKYVKSVVSNCPSDNQIVVTQMDKKILEINDICENYIKPRFEKDFGVLVSALDIGDIDIDKTSEGYKSLMSVTKDLQTQTMQAQTKMNLENQAENLRIQREEMQHATRMQTDSANFAVHQLNQQTNVGIAGANALGQMGAAAGVNLGGGNAGFNPAGMMAGMAMGSAVGQNIAGMMNQNLSGINAQGSAPTPPPVPGASLYNVAVNGQSTGPYDLNTLKNMAANGQFNAQSQVWKAGMASWQAAGQVQELAPIFTQTPPPVPPVPPAQ